MTHTYTYRGLTFGEGETVLVLEVEGLGGGDVRSGDTDLPRGHGSVPGKHFLSARQIRFRFDVVGSEEAVEQQLADIAAAFIVSEDDLFPLEFSRPGMPDRLVYCRPLSHARVEVPTATRHATPGVALIASDPRIYSAEEHTQFVPLYSAAGGGIGAPLNAPINMAAGTTVEVVVTNDGNADAHPTVRFYGPATEVTLTNVTTGDTLTVATTINTGQVLTYAGSEYATATGGHVVSLDGAGRYGSWVERIPFVLPPGESVLRFEADDDAQAVVTWRDTWLS